MPQKNVRKLKLLFIRCNLLIILLIFSLQPLKAQNIDDLKFKYTAIPDVSELENIYFTDVFHYYNISGYSDLKKEVFKQSEEYKSKLNALKELRKNVFSKNYYLDQSYSSDIDTDDGSLRFNLKCKCFSIKNHRLTSRFLKTDYLQINEFCFNTLSGVTVSSIRDPNFNGMLGKADVTFQTHSYGQMDLNTALKIEENSSDIRFLYLFKISFIKEINVESMLSGRMVKNLLFISAPQKIIVYNNITKEIYKIYN